MGALFPCPRLLEVGRLKSVQIIRAFTTPSDADIKVTRDLVRAGQLLKIEVLDHVVIGRGEHKSLRELGYISA